VQIAGSGSNGRLNISPSRNESIVPPASDVTSRQHGSLVLALSAMTRLAYSIPRDASSDTSMADVMKQHHNHQWRMNVRLDALQWFCACGERSRGKCWGDHGVRFRLGK
jgi:hypothetical protein